MKRKETRRLTILFCAASWKVALLVSCCVPLNWARPLLAQVADPNFEFEIRTDKDAYKPNDTIKLTAGLVAKKVGAQGWSYGVRHDNAAISLVSVTLDGTDAARLFNQGFNTTNPIEENGETVGYIQAVILALILPVVVPQSDFFSMADASYKVNGDACSGKSGNFKSAPFRFVGDLAVPNSPPVELNVTVAGIALVPGQVRGKEITVECESVGPGNLTLKFDKTDSDLVADKTSVHDLNILLGNTADDPSDVQGWSYGIQLDDTELEAIKGDPGAAAKALNGGKGPEFTSYNLTDQSASGAVKGVTVGAVIDLNAPGSEVLPVRTNDSKHIDTIQLRTKKEIAEGGASRTTRLKFSDQLGGDRPLEALVVVAGVGIVPDFSDEKDLTLLPKGGAQVAKFIRGDANNDRRVDIADGIWIINFLFYGGPATACRAAANADGAGDVNLTDAMFVFQYQLQPGATPGNLRPAPPAPFPNCGTAADATPANCPQGSTLCPP